MRMTATSPSSFVTHHWEPQPGYANPVEDVRGRKVLDSTGQDLGSVDNLLVDDLEHKLRFLGVAARGFLGLGETMFLIPVEAITTVDDEAVHVDQARGHMA